MWTAGPSWLDGACQQTRHLVSILIYCSFLGGSEIRRPGAVREHFCHRKVNQLSSGGPRGIPEPEAAEGTKNSVCAQEKRSWTCFIKTDLWPNKQTSAPLTPTPFRSLSSHSSTPAKTSRLDPCSKPALQTPGLGAPL